MTPNKRDSLRKRLPHWRYYQDDFDWDATYDRLGLSAPDPPSETHAKLAAAGLSDAEASALLESGFISTAYSPAIIDRYYGGPLMSMDGRTRFHPSELSALPTAPASQVWVKNAGSWSDARNIIDAIAPRRRQLLFRGQTAHFSINRKRGNPNFQVDGLGEPSLVPSVWRRMLASSQSCFPDFESISLFEWSFMLEREFDLDDIERRRRTLMERSPLEAMSLSAMEDSGDPVLAEYAKLKLDLSCGYQFNLADKLATCLQHYGLFSPVLDLTGSFDVARFFATHELVREADRCRYQFVGTNGRRAVLYVMRMDDREMVRPNVSDEPVLRLSRPLRPVRQDCYIAKSSSWATNLPADFLEGIIRLDFDDLDNGPISADELFPPAEDDGFLRALRRLPLAAGYITEFSAPEEAPEDGGDNSDSVLPGGLPNTPMNTDGEPEAPRSA